MVTVVMNRQKRAKSVIEWQECGHRFAVNGNYAFDIQKLFVILMHLIS